MRITVCLVGITKFLCPYVWLMLLGCFSLLQFTIDTVFTIDRVFFFSFIFLSCLFMKFFPFLVKVVIVHRSLRILHGFLKQLLSLERKFERRYLTLAYIFVFVLIISFHCTIFEAHNCIRFTSHLLAWSWTSTTHIYCLRW